MRQASCRLVHRAAATGFLRCPPGPYPPTSSCFDDMGLRVLYQVLVRCMASSADRDGGGKSTIKRGDTNGRRGERYSNKGIVGPMPRKHGGASSKEMQIDEEISSHRGNLEGLLNIAAKHAHELSLESIGRLLHSLAFLADAHSAPLSQAEAIRSDKRFELLISCTHRRLDEEHGRPAKVQSVANVLKSYAWLKYDSEPALTRKVLDRWLVAIRGYPGSDAGAFTRLIQPLTNLKYHPGPDFWSRFNEEWLRFGVHKFRIRDLAAILHAYTHFTDAPLPRGILSSVKAALTKKPLDTGPDNSSRAEDVEKLPMLIHSLASMGTRLEAAEGKELRLPRIAVACVLAKAYAATRHFDQVGLAVVIYSLGQLVWPGLARMGEEGEGEEEFRYQQEHLEILGPLTRLMPPLVIACRRAALHSFSAQQLYMVFDGLTRVAYDPGREFIEDLVTAYASQGDDVMYGKSVSVLLRGLANEYRHQATPAMVEDLAGIYVKQSFKVLGSSDRARAIVALARLRYIPQRPFMDKFVDTCAKYKWKGWVVSELASALDGLSALRIALPSEALPAFVTAFEDAYEAQLFRPQLLKYFGVLLHSLARLQQLDTLESFTLLQALTPSIVHNLGVMARTEQARRHDHDDGGGGVSSRGTGRMNDDGGGGGGGGVSGGGGEDGASWGSGRSSVSAGGSRGVGADWSRGIKHLNSCYTAAMCCRFSLAIEERGKEAKGVVKELDSLIGALRAAGAECVVERPTSSAAEIEDMRGHLEAAGFQAECAHVLSEACVSVDLLLYPRNKPPDGEAQKHVVTATRPVVIELDVPEHYVDMASSTKVLSGDAALKQRVLELAVQRGLIGAWVCVERQQWDKLVGQDDKKVQLVLDKLSIVGVDIELYRISDTEE